MLKSILSKPKWGAQAAVRVGHRSSCPLPPSVATALGWVLSVFNKIGGVQNDVIIFAVFDCIVNAKYFGTTLLLPILPILSVLKKIFNTNQSKNFMKKEQSFYRYWIQLNYEKVKIVLMSSNFNFFNWLLCSDHIIFQSHSFMLIVVSVYMNWYVQDSAFVKGEN